MTLLGKQASSRASGIAEIRYHEDYSNDPIVAQLMAEAGVKITKL